MSETRRGRRQKRRRDELLDTAASLLLERGLEGFSLRELARRTDYTPGALYNFFPNKDAVLQELADRVFERFDAYLAGVPADAPAGARLSWLSDAYLRFATENPEEYLLLFTRIPAPESMTFDDPEAAPTPWRRLIAVFSQGVTSGELGAADDRRARLAFFQFFALHHGLAMLRLTRMQHLPGPFFDELSRGVRESFIAGLVSPDTRQTGDGPDVTSLRPRKERS